jgi:hypothetical protein
LEYYNDLNMGDDKAAQWQANGDEGEVDGRKEALPPEV